mmetsp:Transcript_20753/g.64377  ORF Transcript_20753/g.64377 Transcript_20753/m.64377 type:complete len:223 (+) Transcript_20753:1046-1714(+)
MIHAGICFRYAGSIARVCHVGSNRPAGVWNTRIRHRGPAGLPEAGPAGSSVAGARAELVSAAARVPRAASFSPWVAVNHYDERHFLRVAVDAPRAVALEIVALLRQAARLGAAVTAFLMEAHHECRRLSRARVLVVLAALELRIVSHVGVYAVRRAAGDCWRAPYCHLADAELKVLFFARANGRHWKAPRRSAARVRACCRRRRGDGCAPQHGEARNTARKA